jgi:hypothetical protein
VWFSLQFLHVYRVAKNAHVTQEGDHVKVDTPFGTVETSKDPAQAAKDLGVDLYPGAQAQKTGTANMTFGNVHTVTASFESSDPVDKICDFYKSRLPNATKTSRIRIIAASSPATRRKYDHQSTSRASGTTSKIQIASVSRKASN